jgi:signal transduction histidine kinase
VQTACEGDTSATILVVDDDETGRLAKVEALQHGGFRVRDVPVAAAAVVAAADLPDIIVLDLDRTAGGGFDLCRHVRTNQNTAGIAVLLVSGAVSQPAAWEGVLAADADAYLPSPVEPHRLVFACRALVRRRAREVAAAAARRSLEEQLRQAQKMEAIGQLAGGVAHDFNNILTAILGYCALVLDELDAANRCRADIEEIQKAGTSAALLTRQLLAFSRRQILQPRILDLNDVVARTDGMLKRLIGEHIELRCCLAPSLEPVCADRGQIEQIIMNLALNARDAMPAGGELTITTATVELDDGFVAAHHGASPGVHVMLEVRDTGIGMDASTLAHVFEPFFTTKPQGEGTGLGLATVYGIVKQSGGSIWASSEPGRGATFQIYLPRAATQAGEAADVGASAVARNGTETIVLAEDQPEVRSVARAVLTRHGYTVLEARDGVEALHIVHTSSRPIHLVLTDVIMPVLGGYDLASQLQLTHPEIRFLYTSGYASDAVIHRHRIRPGAAFLYKPFTPDQLAAKVREVLDAPVVTARTGPFGNHE